MQTFSAITLFIAAATSASAAPLAVRQAIGQPGWDFSSINGPTALSNPTINNGALAEGSLDSSTSFDGAAIVNPIGNSMAEFNSNNNVHDNILENPNFNVASNTNGGVVVGNNNQVFPALDRNQHIVFKRQAPIDASSVNAPAAINDPTVNNGALSQGSTDADLSFDGANVQNPVGNTLAQVNDNTEVADNNFVDPNWNSISNNNGPAIAGNDNTVIPINNEGMIVNLDPGFLAAQHAQQAALLRQFIHPGLF
ncbi:hypothetical protein IWW36_002910 [Coemansia brasiliensis]|uniref:Uncharacterized protein n=1 Tax=Coemansia brasiliensis TaxID=2650707 RepID=A0A9W8I6A7_9FUNG|nr:hypothetical protein IWW36_002910 [Coemansia brasiliensis]